MKVTTHTPDNFLPAEYLGKSERGTVTHLDPRAFKDAWESRFQKNPLVEKSRIQKEKMSTKEKHDLRRELATAVIDSGIARLEGASAPKKKKKKRKKNKTNKK